MRPNVIRPIVICVVLNNGRIFVSEDVKPDTGETFYRSLGGGIEYAEHSADAVVRELREEIGAELGTCAAWARLKMCSRTTARSVM